MRTPWAISELLQPIYLSTTSHSSLHPLGCVLCLTRLSNLNNLFVYGHNTFSMFSKEMLPLVCVFNFTCSPATNLRVLISRWFIPVVFLIAIETTDSAEHNSSFIPHELYNMFRLYGPSSCWQKWKINRQFWMEFEISVSYIYVALYGYNGIELSGYVLLCWVLGLERSIRMTFVVKNWWRNRHSFRRLFVCSGLS